MVICKISRSREQKIVKFDDFFEEIIENIWVVR